MSVTLTLPSDTEQILREKAAREGQTLEAYLQALAARDAQAANGTPAGASSQLPADQWIAQWYAWAARQLPRAALLDDSRESIYAGRGE